MAKNGIHSIGCQLTARGGIPRAKNIIVVDGQGNEYGATWPKRARGLVRNGRARFLSENKICLACPPEIDLEDNEMTDKAIETIDMAYIFEQIRAIQNQTDYLQKAIDSLTQMSDGDSGDSGAPGNIQGQAKAEALERIVIRREVTNQQLLDFYMNVYKDLKAQS